MALRQDFCARHVRNPKKAYPDGGRVCTKCGQKRLPCPFEPIKWNESLKKGDLVKDAKGRYFVFRKYVDVYGSNRWSIMARPLRKNIFFGEWKREGRLVMLAWGHFKKIKWKNKHILLDPKKTKDKMD